MRISLVTVGSAGAIAVLLFDFATAEFPVETADLTFVDPERGNRPVPCDVYYPELGVHFDMFPVVAFGHGYLMGAEPYGWLGERLASAGYITVLPRTAAGPFPSHAAFAADLAFVTRAVVRAGDDPTSVLFRLPTDTRLVMGHSMGGGSAVLAAIGDPGLAGIATLAAAETNPSAVAGCGGLSCPVLMLAGADDCVTPPEDHQVPMFAAIEGNWRVLAVLDGASHCQFAAAGSVCEWGEWCSAGISRQEQRNRSWFLLEPWLAVTAGRDPSAVGELSQRLEVAGEWATISQGDAPPPVTPPQPRRSSGRVRVVP